MIISASENVQNKVRDYQDYLKLNNPSYSGMSYFDEFVPDDQQLDFYLTDPLYKNFVAAYHTAVYKNLYRDALRFRFESVLVYIEIQKIINPEQQLPAEIASFLIAQDSSAYAPLCGKYQSENKPDEPVDIWWNGKMLETKLGPLYQLADSSFTITGSQFYRFKNGKIELTIPTKRKPSIFSRVSY